MFDLISGKRRLAWLLFTVLGVTGMQKAQLLAEPDLEVARVSSGLQFSWLGAEGHEYRIFSASEIFGEIEGYSAASDWIEGEGKEIVIEFSNEGAQGYFILSSRETIPTHSPQPETVYAPLSIEGKSLNLVGEWTDHFRTNRDGLETDVEGDGEEFVFVYEQINEEQAMLVNLGENWMDLYVLSFASVDSGTFVFRAVDSDSEVEAYRGNFAFDGSVFRLTIQGTIRGGFPNLLGRSLDFKNRENGEEWRDQFLTTLVGSEDGEVSLRYLYHELDGGVSLLINNAFPGNNSPGDDFTDIYVFRAKDRAQTSGTVRIHSISIDELGEACPPGCSVSFDGRYTSFPGQPIVIGAVQ